MFRPLLNSRGLLVDSVGAIIGVGPGRGIGLMFICFGTSMTLVAIVAYCVPAVRKIDEMEDVLSSSGGTTFVGSDAGDNSAGSVQQPMILANESRPEITV